jgi:hypothetical protein
MTTTRKYFSRDAVREEILKTLTDFPGATTREIVDLLGNIKLELATQIVHQLYTRGYIVQNGVKVYVGTNGKAYNAKTYAVSATPGVHPTDGIVRGKYKVKAKKPADNDMTDSDVMAALKARVLELESWKFDAITRYPDLAADPIVLKARRLVSEEVRASGDGILADRILAGNKDDGLLMRVTIKALEEANV